MDSRQLFIFAFRCAEALYRKPGQPVKSESEIMAEYPDIPAPQPIAQGQWSDFKPGVGDCQVLDKKELEGMKYEKDY